MTNTPENTPITITLPPEVAAALMAVTSSYVAVPSWERRLDYALTELAEWQSVIPPIQSGDVHEIAIQACEAFHTVRELVENSIQAAINR